jgi:gluconokinase
MVSGAGLLNIYKCDYDDEVLSFIGIGRDQLSRLTGFDEIFLLSLEGAAALGLDPGIPVVPTGSDGGLNQVGAGATEEGVMTFSMGTSGALRLTVDHPVIADDHCLWCYVSPISWMSGAATQGCCNCVDWAKQKLFPKDMSYADIEKGFRGGPEDTPVFLPFLYGERCPGWDDTRQGGFAGVLPQHGAHDFYHAVLEGTLYNLYQCYCKLSGYNGIPHEVQLSGGILNSIYWTQMCADLFGLPMTLSETEHCSLIGGAMLGLKTLGIPSDFLIRSSKEKIVLPDLKMTPRYEEKYGRYLKTYKGLMQ